MTTTNDLPSTPTRVPPAAAASATQSTAAGPDLARTGPEGGSAVSAAVTAATTTGMPTLPPPPRTQTAAAGAVGAVTTTIWQTNKTVVGLWSDSGTRNAWALVDGLGWRKLFDGSDGAFYALVLLASQARETAHPVTFREDDGIVKEIYLW